MNFATLSLAWFYSPEFVDLTDRQRILLIMIVANDRLQIPLSTGGYAAAMDVSKPVITRATNTLTELGLVERVRGEDDRRLCLIVPTAKGMAVIKAMQQLR